MSCAESAWLYQHREIHQGQANGARFVAVETQKNVVVQLDCCCCFLAGRKGNVENVSVVIVAERWCSRLDYRSQMLIVAAPELLLAPDFRD